jgi:hypothetical protein
MTDKDKLEQLEAFVQNLAKAYDPEEPEDITENENWNPWDMSGGNYDDAFWGGVRHGKWVLAREAHDLLSSLPTNTTNNA